MPPVDFNNLVNDTGDNLSGTFMDKAELQTLLLGAVIFNVSTGTVHNAAPTGMAGHTVCFWSGAADVQWTGLAGGVAGQRFLFKNNSAGKIATFPHNSGSSSAGTRFSNYATSAGTPVAPGGYIAWQYDGAAWQIIGHEQGAYITAPFAAGNFTGSGAMTWTVDAGDVVTCAYKLRGRGIHLILRLIATTTAGTAANVLNVGNGAWGGFSVSGTSFSPCGQLNDGGGVDGGNVLGTGTVVGISKITGANFALGVNAVNIQGDCEFPVS